MFHNLAGATIQVANLVNYNCHPQENGDHTNLRSIYVFVLMLYVPGNTIFSHVCLG